MQKIKSVLLFYYSKMLEVWDLSFPFRLCFPKLIPTYTAIADTAQNQRRISCKSLALSGIYQASGQHNARIRIYTTNYSHTPTQPNQH